MLTCMKRLAVSRRGVSLPVSRVRGSRAVGSGRWSREVPSTLYPRSSRARGTRRRMRGFEGWGRHLRSGPAAAAKPTFALTHPSNLRETIRLTTPSSSSLSRHTQSPSRPLVLTREARRRGLEGPWGGGAYRPFRPGGAHRPGYPSYARRLHVDANMVHGWPLPFCGVDREVLLWSSLCHHVK
jgi:hypothetical protein